MIQNFQVTINAIIPMFLPILIGMLLKRIKLVNDDTVTQVNKALFQVLLPILLFYNVYNLSTDSIFHPPLIFFAVCAVFAVWLLTVLFVCIYTKHNKIRGAMIQGIYRSNFLLFGIPLITNLYGSGHVGVATIMVAIVIPVFNILAVVTLEIFRGGKPKPLNILFNIINNPLILGLLLGYIVLISGVRFPSFIETGISAVAGMVTPMALIFLGAALKFERTESSPFALTFTTIGKLMIVPLLTLPLAVVLGFRDVELATLIAIFASPTAVSSYPMAVSMESDGSLAARIIVLTTLISTISIFLWIFVFKQFGLL